MCFLYGLMTGGHVVVECVSPVNHQTLQLVMDYITDAVVSTTMLSGRPHVSPDSRHVVTVDDLTGKVSVAGVNNEGEISLALSAPADLACIPSGITKACEQFRHPHLTIRKGLYPTYDHKDGIYLQ